jgi:RNA polymerase sigma factor (sigma-70 family)
VILQESDLIKQLRAGDKSALSYLYDHYSAALYGIIFRIVKREEWAEEVLQDAFLKIWDRIDAYDESKGRLFTWMMNLTRNLAIDKTRSKEITRAKKTDDLHEFVNTIDKQEQTEMAIEQIGLLPVLEALPPEQKLIVEQLYLKGYTQSEVADEFGIPLGTVKTRLRLAMITLRTILKVE